MVLSIYNKNLRSSRPSSPIPTYVVSPNDFSMSYSEVHHVTMDVVKSYGNDGIKVEEDEQQHSPRRVVSKKAKLIEISRLAQSESLSVVCVKNNSSITTKVGL